MNKYLPLNKYVLYSMNVCIMDVIRMYFMLVASLHPTLLWFDLNENNVSCAGVDLVNWGPQANIGMGPYIFTHIYLDQHRGSFFCCDACCCTMPHSCDQCFYMYHVRYNGTCLFTFKFIHLADTFIFSCCITWFIIEIKVLTKNEIHYKMINFTI